ncbi:16S rRNA (guanine1207-N2)-methyltransferase [Loktanella ponticola]|uniref:16S rRNA (Guanine1207-N2)-methyltransferase n=1 Tax=Yoonia ponticola TaxID=1524255 RepID=A0A7W9BI78_9RHOB|nr:methyltransferase [Yoonia ponticola]MBB5721002.1 16S rRNA (guanine1207-N2)-methyltransferase [Yoonia ponticola]
MSAYSRLSTALTEGSLTLPDGPVRLMRPPLDYDVNELPQDRLHIQHTFKPDAAGWLNAGYPVSDDFGQAETAIVVLPRAKALAKAMIAEAASKAKLVVIDGTKTDGVDSIFKMCRKALGDLPSIPKDHGRIFWFEATDAFADWTAPAPAKGDHGYITTAGVFSDGAIDAGSKLLIESLPAKLPAHMADVGAGWGYLAGPVLGRAGVQSLDLIEAEALSLNCARLNVQDPRAKFLWEDATNYRPAKGYDGIVMNPPFHVGRSADPSLGRTFIASAAKMLAGHGKLWMVANRHLPYEQALNDAFRNVEKIAQNNAFKVFHATRPLR